MVAAAALQDALSFPHQFSQGRQPERRGFKPHDAQVRLGKPKHCHVRSVIGGRRRRQAYRPKEERRESLARFLIDTYSGSAMKVIRVVHPSTSTTVRQLMSRPVVCGDPRHSLTEAAAEMRSHRVSALAVLDNGAIAGIITERDLLRAIADHRDPGATHVSQYMTHSPKTVEASQLATVAAEKMIRHRVRHLPVTDDGRLIGFISARDLLSLTPWPVLPIGEAW